MSLVELFGMILAFDLEGIIGVVMGNLLWLFALAMASHIVAEGNLKKTITFFLTLSTLVLLYYDVNNVFLWSWGAGAFLSIYYISKFAFLMFLQDRPVFKKRFAMLSELQFLVLFAAFNIYTLNFA